MWHLTLLEKYERKGVIVDERGKQTRQQVRDKSEMREYEVRKQTRVVIARSRRMSCNGTGIRRKNEV